MLEMGLTEIRFSQATKPGPVLAQKNSHTLAGTFLPSLSAGQSDGASGQRLHRPVPNAFKFLPNPTGNIPSHRLSYKA
jgi:hypothetical protein